MSWLVAAMRFSIETHSYVSTRLHKLSVGYLTQESASDQPKKAAAIT